MEKIASKNLEKYYLEKKKELKEEYAKDSEKLREELKKYGCLAHLSKDFIEHPKREECAHYQTTRNLDLDKFLKSNPNLLYKDLNFLNKEIENL